MSDYCYVVIAIAHFSSKLHNEQPISCDNSFSDLQITSMD